MVRKEGRRGAEDWTRSAPFHGSADCHIFKCKLVGLAALLTIQCAQTTMMQLDVKLDVHVS